MTEYIYAYVISCDALNLQELFILTLNNVTLRKPMVHNRLHSYLSFLIVVGFLGCYCIVVWFGFVFSFYIKIYTFQGKYMSTSHLS